jgi:hypothetical protein
VLDGRRRRDIRVTVILDPGLALICWVHYAPPINDSFRASYRKLLRWNDELPFVKFAVAPDERPILACEVPIGELSGDMLGLALARVIAVCDLLLDESVSWLWPGARQAPTVTGEPRNAALLGRYGSQLGETLGGPLDG